MPIAESIQYCAACELSGVLEPLGSIKLADGTVKIRYKCPKCGKHYERIIGQDEIDKVLGLDGECPK